MLDTRHTIAYFNSPGPSEREGSRPVSHYDADGNLVSDGVRTFAWDAEGRGHRVATPSEQRLLDRKAGKIPGFVANPGEEDRDDAGDFLVGQGAPRGNAMPLGETAAAACRRAVLREEHGMAAHRGLAPVVAGIGRSEALPDDFQRLRRQRFPAVPRDIGPVRVRKMEAGSERRAPKTLAGGCPGRLERLVVRTEGRPICPRGCHLAGDRALAVGTVARRLGGAAAAVPAWDR